MENGPQGDRGGHIDTTEEAIAEIQARDEAVLDQGAKNRDCILHIFFK